MWQEIIKLRPEINNIEIEKKTRKGTNETKSQFPEKVSTDKLTDPQPNILNYREKIQINKTGDKMGGLNNRDQGILGNHKDILKNKYTKCRERRSKLAK